MSRPRARDLGVPLKGTTGPKNAITDVGAIEVGCKTLITGACREAVRTGVTAIHPRGRANPHRPVLAGLHSFNGNGELTGSHWLSDSGQFSGPILLTNTHSVGVAHHAACRWMTAHATYLTEQHGWCLPVVGETCDAWLNDMNGYHVTEVHVLEALDSAHRGAVEEGNAGGGTGMICYEFKGGNGTASRSVRIDRQPYMVGAFVQANFGRRRDLTILGHPVGIRHPEGTLWSRDQGSIIIVIATDAPLVPVQLQRLARRGALGMGRTGTYGGNGSGDIFLAFSTARMHPGAAPVVEPVPNTRIDVLFDATVMAVEEAIINALVAAEDMTGYADHTVSALSHLILRRLFLV